VLYYSTDLRGIGVSVVLLLVGRNGICKCYFGDLHSLIKDFANGAMMVRSNEALEQIFTV
jgi:hypothetical protein